MTSTLLVLALASLIQATPQETFDRYINALRANDSKGAAACWTEEAIRESNRLCIVFTDAPPKYDNASVVVTHLAAIINGNAKVSVGDATLHDGWVELPVMVKSSSDSVETTYFLEQSDGGWKISSPLSIYSRGWKTLATEYAEIHYRDSTLLNDYAIEQLDRFIESACKTMGMPEERIAGLKRIKIPYYLGDKEDVKALTGFETFGMTNLQFDAVITQYLPHPHELTHLLIDYLLKEQPLYTLPFLQEGVACHFGGRWGKSVAVIDQMGCYLLENEVVQLDSVLTWRGFYQSVGMSDLTYPVSSEFVGFLIQQGGFDKFLKLYRAESGAPDSLMKLTVEEIHGEIERICDKEWGDLMMGFKEYRKQHTYSGIEPGASANTNRQYEADFSENCMMVGNGGSEYIIRRHLVKPEEFVTFFITAPYSSHDSLYRSKLFTEHNPDSTWRGEIGALRFNAREAGYYDYRTNTLEAKYVTAFNPSESYWDEKTKVVTFRIKKTLIPKNALQIDGSK